MNRFKFKLLLILIISLKYGTSQVIKPLNKLSNIEYQEIKEKGLLPIYYPSVFEKGNVITSKPSKGNTQLKNKVTSNNNQKKKNGLKFAAPATFQSMQAVDCGTLAYEPPITIPTTDLNGDLVTDTIVPFTNGVPPFYRNDDGTSPAFTLPFQFCFYGNVINAPGSANQNFYVNNNGSISFGVSYPTPFSAPNFPSVGFTMIGGFFGDVDTRGDSSDVVYMRRMPHYAVFKWHRVGYFSQQVDKLNSFMIVISDGTSPIIPDGLNASLYYGDMNWTTGAASQGVNGFGGIPATVGANAGDGINFIKIGRFDHAGIDYDGPNGINDGVDWLDNKNFYFSACGSTANLPPIALGLNLCDTLSICVGDTFNYDFTYLGPEVLQNVTITIVPPANPAGFTSYIDYSAPTAPVGHIQFVSNNLGAVQFQVFATDNATPALSSNLITLTIQTTFMAGSAYHIDAGCNTNNGVIAYNLTSGAPPFQISTDSGATFMPSNIASNLSGGTYDVQIMDAGGCLLDTTISVYQPQSLTFDSTSSPLLGVRDVSCFGQSNGSASYLVSGSANSQFVYNWITPNPLISSNTNTIYGLPANSSTNPNISQYWFVAIDFVNQCRDSIPFVVTEPDLLTNSVATNHILCLGSSGTLTTSIDGGTGPYSIAWQTAPSQDSVTAINLLAGTYSVDITDANNCTSSAFGTLIDGSVLHHEIVTTPISCHGFNDGKVSVRLFDGKPSYQIKWVIPGIPPYLVNSDKDSVLSLNRLNGYVVLFNENLCDPDTITFSISEPDTLQALITTTNASCLVAKNGAVKVDVVGGIQPYSYLWTTDTDKNSQGVNNLYQGIDTVTITDANNCEIQAIAVVGYDSNFVVTAKPDFVYDAQANNNLWVTVDKPGNYTYTWNNAEAINDSTIVDPLLNQVFFPLDFRIDVIDEFGCSGFDSVYVDVVPFIYIPSAFSPNGDKLNDTLEIAFSNFKISNFSLNVYDRWGGKVFATQNPKFKWDGKVDYKDATIGMYNYDISYVDNRNKNQKLRGAFTLIR